MKQHITQPETTPDLLNEAQLWGAPRHNDAAFLVALRTQLSRPMLGLWLSSRNVVLVSGLAAVLLIGVWIPVESNYSVIADIPQLTLDNTVEEFVVEDADPNDLADYLGVPESFADEQLESDYIVTGVSESELLELEPQELEFVLAELQETVFF